MPTSLQTKTAQAIVNIFETGRPHGDYGSVTVMAGDTGHLTYGRSQTTLASGNLALLLHAYCDAGGLFSDALRPYLPACDRSDIRLDNDDKLKGLLRRAGDDPVMRTVQDGFFDRVYWKPALATAGNLGIISPLGVAVVYDSKVHGSFGQLRKNTDNKHGQTSEIGERSWIPAYVMVRRAWLMGHKNRLLRRTAYRMDAFNALIQGGRWELQLPLTVRGVVIDDRIFKKTYRQPVVVSACDTARRVLFYTRPMMKGDDVVRLQVALGFSGSDIDGAFGPGTDRAVRAFQKKSRLKEDGKVGPATSEALNRLLTH